jgi:predicted nucleotidyltransferase component of viral defense system
MIPKAIILVLAKEEALRETTVEKDYVLGWMLYGVARHPYLSRWVFKGGTCLKKCFFETYRFSEGR